MAQARPKAAPSQGQSSSVSRCLLRAGWSSVRLPGGFHRTFDAFWRASSIRPCPPLAREMMTPPSPGPRLFPVITTLASLFLISAPPGTREVETALAPRSKPIGQ
jgi:hypothetical protein